jgi:hypothetical protein
MGRLLSKVLRRRSKKRRRRQKERKKRESQSLRRRSSSVKKWELSQSTSKSVEEEKQSHKSLVSSITQKT